MSIVHPNFNFQIQIFNIRFLAKYSIFGQIFDFWPNIRLLAKYSVLGQDLNSYQKFQLSAKFRFFVKKSYFSLYSGCLILQNSGLGHVSATLLFAILFAICS